MNQVYLGLGSNQGNRQEMLNRAIDLISEQIGHVAKISTFIETAPWGFISDKAFLNAVLLVETPKKIDELLAETQSIEKTLGRKSKSNGSYSDRLIDIDILFFNNDIYKDHHITVPHPLLHMRSFVLEPLSEIAPGLEHPVLHKNIKMLWEELFRTL